MLRVRIPYWVLREPAIKSRISKFLSSPLGHGLVVGAQMVAMRVVVGPIADGLVVERVEENGFSFCEGRWVGDGGAFGVFVMRGVLVDAAVEGVPVSLAGVD
jgi:hypothetical protein